MARAAGKKQTRRGSAGRSAKRSSAGAKKRAAAKRPASRTVAARKRATAKRATAKRPAAKAAARARRPAARVRRPAPVVASTPTAVTAFAAQRAGASLRDQLLFELQRARASVKAAIQGLSPGNAARPIAPRKWSPLEIVLHLGERDRVRLEEFARTLGGQQRTWAGISDADMAAVNEAHLAPLRAHSWESAVRRLDSLREALLLRLNEVPALPDDVWRRGHAFADMLWGLPEHDRHHAEQLKRARIGEPVPVED